MTFWAFLDRRWPKERGWVTIATFALAASMLKMAEVHRELWNVELFKTLLTLVIGTAIVNMILAFHFTANKADEAKTENTGKLADAFRSVAENSTGASDTPQPVTVTNPPSDPVPIKDIPNPEFTHFEEEPQGKGQP